MVSSRLTCHLVCLDFRLRSPQLSAIWFDGAADVHDDFVPSQNDVSRGRSLLARKTSEEIISNQYLRYLAFESDLLNFDDHADHYFFPLYLEVIFTALIKFRNDVENVRNDHGFHHDHHQIVFVLKIRSSQLLILIIAQQR